MRHGIIYVDHTHGEALRACNSIKRETEEVHEKNMGASTVDHPKNKDHEVALVASRKNYGFPIRGKDVYEVAYNVAASEEAVKTVLCRESTNLDAKLVL